MDIFKKDTLCTRSHLNCDAVVSLWIWYLPIKQCVSFYRKTSGREMCVKGTKARCFSRVLLSFIHTEESARSSLQPFSVKGSVKRLMFFVSPLLKRGRLNVNRFSLGIGIWTEKTLNFKKWLIGNLPERSIKIRTDRRVMNYQYSPRISNMANTSRAIASKINPQY